MSVPATRPVFPLPGAAWLALVLAHGFLQLAAPRGIPGDPLLPLWARLSLLATEALILAVAVALAFLPFRALSLAANRLPPMLRPALGALRCAMSTAILIALTVSWSMFWLSGAFLDGPGLRYASGNIGTLLSFGASLHPFLVYGMPGLLFALSIVACELFPRWLPDNLGGLLTKTACALSALVLVAALAGEIGHRFSTQKVTDPLTGAVYAPDDLYRLRRDRNAGPLTHLASMAWGSRDPFESESAGPGPDLIRRPIVPMEQYLSRVDRAQVKRWNVVVVLVDSLRVDQLRAAGGPREVMPVLEGLAREGRVFNDCIAQATHTDYSAPAVFSSHYPLRARDVYRYPKNPAYPRVMIYDVLKSLGWRTALFSSQNEEWSQMTDYMQTGSLDVLRDARTLGAAEQSGFAAAVDDSVTISEALRWVDAGGDVPFFLYLNLQNSHLPYPMPADFPRRFGPSSLDFKISIGWYPQEKAAIVKEVYADSLAYVDTQLDRVVRRLRETGAWDRTLVVVTGDHGEAFYEHGSAAHANGVHQEVLRVPLVFRAPGLSPGLDARPAQLLDVAPGVFHLLGLPVHPSFQGEDPFAPAFRQDRVRYSLSDTPWKTQFGVLRSGFKLIRDGEGGSGIFYDLKNDPGERTDAAAAHPAVAADLNRRLIDWRRAQLEYYENPLRQRSEYPPVLKED